MNFKYPISKEDSTDYNAEDLYSILSREKSGHYLLGNHQFWHGGIHFSTETVEQCALKQPIRCIADGEVIAYRINKKYKESKLNTTTLQYSNSFCLVKHTYKSPSEPVKTPAKDPAKLNDDWKGKKIRILAPTFPSYTDEALSQGKKFMPKSLMLEILQVSSTTKAIGKIEYYPIKAKVLQSVEAKGAKTKEASDAFTKDDEIWFCAFKSDASIRESKDYKVNLFKDITPQDWTSKTITLAKTYTGYKEIADSTSTTAEKIVVPEKTALQIKEVQTETTNDYHYSKVTASTALKMQDAQDKLLPNKELKAGEEFWIALTDNDGYVPTTADDKELYSDTTPPPEPKTNNLTFYSLYMHLLPYEQYPTQKDEVQRQAKVVKGGLRARDKIIDDKDTKVLGKISKDTIVNILEVKEDEAGNNNCARVTIADNSGKITQINETTKKEEEVTPPANGFWIVLKDKQTNNGKTTWNEYATEIPQPKREYPSYWTQQVTAKVIMDGMSTRQAPDAGSDVAGATLLIKLSKDDEVTYSNSKVKTLKISGKDYRMAECKLTKEKPEFTKAGITTFWACVESSYMTTTKATPNTFDTIDTSNAVKISAGDPVGYLGLYEVPASPSGGKSDKPKKQVHIEVFTLAEETDLKKFLDNEAGLMGGKQYIKIPKGTVLDKQQAEEAGATTNTLNSTWQNKETKTLANTFVSYASEKLESRGKKKMPKGLKLKILQVKDTTTKIGSTNYYVAKAKVLEDIKADLTSTHDYKKDEEIWFAAFTANKKIIYSAPQKTNLLQDVTPKPTEAANKDKPQTTEQLQEVYYKTQYDHIISPDSAKLVNNKYLVTLYENRQSITGCVAQNKIEKISQYELTKLGFTLIKEQNTNADGSVSTTNTDGFIDQTKMTQFYQDLCKEMDSKENGGNGDGKLSLAELRSALKDPVLSEKWSKLIAYHPTEWQAKGDDPKWQRLDSDILQGEANKALREHEKERITNLVFWDDVSDLKGKKVAFHFHPVAFVEHLQFKGVGIATFHIFYDGRIEKHIPAAIKSGYENKYQYIYHDKNGVIHDICTADWHLTKKKANGVRSNTIPSTSGIKSDNNVSEGNTSRRVIYNNGDIAEYGRHPSYGLIWRLYRALNEDIEIVKMPDQINYSKDDTIIKYNFSNTKRRYTGPGPLAGFIGALADIGLEITTTGSCFSEASCFPSAEHVNGDSVDTLYFLSVERDQNFINAMHKFHFKKILAGSSAYFYKTVNKKKTYVFTNAADGGTLHDSHLHSGNFDSSQIKIVRTIGDSLSTTENNFTIADAKTAIKKIYDTHGKDMAIIIERMYRDETAHFSSLQYKRCGTGGMESFGSAPYYGWDSSFFTQNPSYTPTGTWSAYENKGMSGQGGNTQVTDRKKVFVVLPSVLAGMEYKVFYINKHNGNWARWHSTDATAQTTYKEYIEKITPKFVNEIEASKNDSK